MLISLKDLADQSYKMRIDFDLDVNNRVRKIGEYLPT
jgi:hypothetical protein